MYVYVFVCQGSQKGSEGFTPISYIFILFQSISIIFNLFHRVSYIFSHVHTISIYFILFHTISYYFQLPTTAGCHGTGSSTFPRFWWFFHGRSFLGSHQRGRPPLNFNTMGRQLKKVVTECGWDLHCSNRWMMKVEHMCPLIFSEHEKPKLHYILLQYATATRSNQNRTKRNGTPLLHPHKHP